MQPCEQRDEIKRINDKLDSRDAVLTSLQVKQADIAGDVSHIKQRIDNGMSTTIARMDANLTSLKPVLDHHADIVKRIEDMGWLVSRITLSFIICSLIGVIIWAISKGFTPKI